MKINKYVNFGWKFSSRSIFFLHERLREPLGIDKNTVKHRNVQYKYPVFCTQKCFARFKTQYFHLFIVVSSNWCRRFLLIQSCISSISNDITEKCYLMLSYSKSLPKACSIVIWVEFNRVQQYLHFTIWHANSKPRQFEFN